MRSTLCVRIVVVSEYYPRGTPEVKIGAVEGFLKMGNYSDTVKEVRLALMQTASVKFKSIDNSHFRVYTEVYTIGGRYGHCKTI